jgi:hypothetical protein
MNKIIIALASTAAFAAAMPAAAQTAHGSMQFRTDQLRTQLQAGVQSGAITRAEAMPLRQELRQLSDLERRYAAGGVNGRERADLQNRTATLRQGIRMAASTGNSRYDRDDDRWSDGRDCPPGLEGRNNGCLPPGQVGRENPDGRWDDDRSDRQWTDRNRDGYDDRDLNHDRRIDDREVQIADRRDDDRYQREEDRYEDGNRRGGIGGVIDNVLGGGGLRVGQRVSGNLGPVPTAYRDEFRDGNGSYYRSDGQRIYRIDASTQTVVRVHSMNR